jgi:transposase
MGRDAFTQMLAGVNRPMRRPPICPPKMLAAYAGLVPSTCSSGGKTWHGKIIRQGNKWLRWASGYCSAVSIASAGAAKFEEVVALHAEAHAKQFADRRFVIDDQYLDVEFVMNVLAFPSVWSF